MPQSPRKKQRKIPKIGVDNLSPAGYNADNQTSKPLEGREVEFRFLSQRAAGAGNAAQKGFRNGLSEGPVNGRGACHALLDGDGTQTRYQAAPYVGTG